MLPPSRSPAGYDPAAATAPETAVLAVAHPGHELVVHGWLERARPVVLVLTDGSGSAGASRLDSTRRVLAAAGARPGALFGLHTDRELYDALLDGRTEPFISAAERVSGVLADERVTMVAGDAAEGFNPIHDVWRSVVDAAVAVADRRRRRPLDNRHFRLFARQSDLTPAEAHVADLVELDGAGQERKLAAARGYPELSLEVRAAIAASADGLLTATPDLAAGVRSLANRLGPEAYRVECLLPVVADEPAPGPPPFYELYGERLVAAGRFARVIRRAAHVRPIQEALAGWAHGAR